MKLRRLACFLVLLAVILGTAWLVNRFQPASTPDFAPIPAPPAPPPVAIVPSAPAVASPPPVPSASPPAADAAAIAVDQVRLMFRDYRTLMGENPVGTNAEIMRALMGDNPRQATVGPPEGQTLNDQGELVDSWGTPLFFHQLSKTVMEIRSAGPDKIMGTEDDIVTR